MPIKSLAQLRKFYALQKEGKMSQKTIDKWLAETPNTKDLPPKAPAQPGGLIRGPRKSRRVRK
jgi:hypothetical protein